MLQSKLLLICLVLSVFCIGTYGDLADESLTSLESFLNRYWDSSSNYLYQNYPHSDASLSQYWNFAESYETLINGIILTEKTGNSQLNSKLWQYCSDFYDGQNSIGWNRDYYDDMNWMTMSLMRVYFLSTGKINADIPIKTAEALLGHDIENRRFMSETIRTQSNQYLSTAENLYNQIMSAWDTSCCGNLCGGIWWDTAHSQKATAANAGPVISGVYLYLATNNQTYLSFAEQVFNFWQENMVNSQTFQVADHFDSDGNVVWWKYTYNEGLMIGACVALHHITNNSTYLDIATNIGGFMASAETIGTSYGPVLNDGDNSQCTGTDCPQFKGIGFSGLFALQQVAPSTTFENVIQASVNSIWKYAQTPDNLFGTAWQGPAPDAGTVLTTAQETSAITPLLICARPPSCV